MLVNESPLDRGLRAAAAVVALVVAFVVGAGSVAGIILIVVAAILAVTAAVGFCPLYRILGIRTAKPEATLPS
jgi:predicted RND superfamily exporter protein